MGQHVIIDTGSVDGNYDRRPGCAVCGLSAELCERHPECCGKADEHSIAPADQRAARAQKRQGRKEGTMRTGQQRVAFVSGHMDLTNEEFERHYEPAIRAAYAQGAAFVVGDAPGCDFMAQRLLARLEDGTRPGSDRVRVFHMLERPRHSYGRPKDGCSEPRGGFPLVGGFASDQERDAAMTAASTEDIAWVRPGKKKRNSGAARNLQRRVEQGRAVRLRERATWPLYNVEDDVLDDGTRWIRVRPPGDGYGTDMRLPPELVARLEAAVKERNAAYERVQQCFGEVRDLCCEAAALGEPAPEVEQ